MKKFLTPFLPFLFLVVFITSCSDEDVYPIDDWEGRSEGKNYSWAHDDNGLLYCTSKTMDESTYLTKVCEYAWKVVARRMLGIDLKWETDMHNPYWWTGGGESYYYYTTDKCLSFARISPESSFLTDAKWIYEENTITWENGRCGIHGDYYNLIGMLSDVYLERIQTFYSSSVPSRYGYEIYQRCEDFDIDEMLNSAITFEELERLRYEWALSQRQNEE